ncbi:hypothetical protein QJS10_CPB12g00781 [Acorus calamus]|uniref:Uncharacterized protein n=1 Tax=Acorus calamus TaxID=4465 RepID=A0AAV9DMN4_ACOCL|nr:hypothetical protein QJS10_CPB12g00781 [Acorus calamus]
MVGARKNRREGDRNRESDPSSGEGPRRHDVFCFRCLSSGHRSWAYRDPIICRKCRGTGHRAAARPRSCASPSSPGASSDSSKSCIRLPKDFDTRSEVVWLSQSVIAEVHGWSQTLVHVKELMFSFLGNRIIERVRSIGGDSFVISGSNAWLKEKLVSIGKVSGKYGSLTFHPWTPDFDTLPQPHC